MHLLAADLGTEHIALGISLVSVVATILLGILTYVRTSPKKENDQTAQSVECKFEHQTLADVVNRVERQGEVMLSTQREIVTTLGRVALVLDRLERRLEPRLDRPTEES